MLVFDPHASFNKDSVKIMYKKEGKMPEGKSFGFMKLEEVEKNKESNNSKLFWSNLSKKIITSIIMLLLTGALIFAGSEFMNLRKQVYGIVENRTELQTSINPRLERLEIENANIKDDITNIRVDNAEILARLEIILNALETE